MLFSTAPSSSNLNMHNPGMGHAGLDCSARFQKTAQMDADEEFCFHFCVTRCVLQANPENHQNRPGKEKRAKCNIPVTGYVTP